MQRQNKQQTGLAIWWIRDDLRLEDNQALCAAAAHQQIIAVYVNETVPGARALGGASKWWLDKSLRALAGKLRQHGVPLILKSGHPRQAITEVVAETGAAAVYWQRRYHLPYREADAEIKQTLRSSGVKAHSYPGYLLFEPWTVQTQEGGSYKVYSAFARACNRIGVQLQLRENPLTGQLRQEIEQLPESVQPWAQHETFNAELDKWDMHPSRPDWSGGLAQRFKPGEDGAHQQIERMEEFLGRYKTDRDIPALAGTSYLSPHLRFGEISPARVWACALEVSEAEGSGVSTFLSELLWREFAWHRLFHVPDLATQNIRKEFDYFPWEDDPESLTAWQRGETGIKIVDAGMKELWHTGYMHNRVRMIVASLLVKNLRIHWKAGEEWFWDTLVDADEAANPFNWQWVAGSGDDAAPYFRIFNPDLQAKKFDPDGIYQQRWAGNEMHLAIVDLKLSRQIALDAYQDLKQYKS